MWIRMILMLLLVGLVGGGVVGFKMFGHSMMMKHMAGMGNAPQTVSTTIAATAPWQDELRAVGTLRATKGADLAAEAAGLVLRVAFESGADVEEGDVLIELRADEERARIEALEAALALAEVTLERNEKQLKAQAISQAAYDADKTNRDRLAAQLAEQKAALAKKTLRAPFAGRLGLRQIDEGQFVQAGTPVVTLQQLDTLYLDFTVPQDSLHSLTVGQKLTATVDALEEPLEAEITAIEARANERTRTLIMRAKLVNPDKKLRPGMFARVSAPIGAPRDLLTLPQTAITFNPYGSTVFIVKDRPPEENGTVLREAVMAFVETGARRGDQIAILSGIAAGDEVVTAGQLKLRNGALVTINNEVQPLSDPAPHPQDR